MAQVSKDLAVPSGFVPGNGVPLAVRTNFSAAALVRGYIARYCSGYGNDSSPLIIGIRSKTTLGELV